MPNDAPDPNPSVAAASPTPPPSPASKAAAVAMRIAIFIGALLVAYLITIMWNRWQSSRGNQTTDDAYLQADLVSLSSKVSGYVRNVPVDDFERVKSGQLVVEIVDDDYRALEAQAEANVAISEESLANIAAQRALQQSNILAAQAVVRATQALRDRNKLEADRQVALNNSGAGTPQSVEQASASFAQLDAQLKQNRAQVSAAKTQLDVLAAQDKQAHASLAAQRAALELAKLNLGYTRIVAPEAGVLGQRIVRPGQYVTPGQQVFALVPLPNLWVIANYKETQLTHLKLGQHATVTVDAFPGVTLTGHVVAYAPASGSQFALLPPDNATGNFTKVVQRIAVKISLDNTADLADRLRPGMSVVSTIDMQ